MPRPRRAAARTPKHRPAPARKTAARRPAKKTRTVRPGRAPRATAADVRLRGLNLHDVERILEIDETITRVPRGTGDNDLWRLLAETTTCFGADVDGRLAGFVLADVRPWEFGNRSPTGWIIALGVDPAFQKAGVGRTLGDRVLQEFRKLGVSEMKTLVGRNNRGLLAYFKALGFRPGSEVVLRLDGGRPARATP